MTGSSLRDRVRSSDFRGRAAAPWCEKEPVEVDLASDQDASRAPPLRGFPGTSVWATAPG